ncbi:MAG: RNA polymerase sigma factor [Planctomycetota bacterium]
MESNVEVTPEVLNVLVAHHEKFLRFLQSRVQSRETAEDILQNAFAKGIEVQNSLRSQDSAVAWFFRLLRNALTDHFRRQDVEDRALEGISWSTEESEDPELEAVICACINDLIPTLKEEYADILRQVDLEGVPIKTVAQAEHITANNAMVRLHRARKALHGRLVQSCGTCTAHGCLNCSCQRKKTL